MQSFYSDKKKSQNIIIDKKVEAFILMPVFEDRISIMALLKKITKISKLFYFVIVDDGSINYPIDENIFSQMGLHGSIISLKTNVGHQSAIACGLNFLANILPEDIPLIIMDSDGEDDPLFINTMIKKFNKNTEEIIVAQRTIRHENLLFKILYKFYKLFFWMLTGQVIDFGNYSCFGKAVLVQLLNQPRRLMHLAAALLSLPNKIVKLPCGKLPRIDGESKMNFLKLILHGVSAILVFSKYVFIRVSIGAFFTMIICLLMIILAFILKVFGLASPGWFSLALGLLMIFALQLGTLSFLAMMLIGINPPNDINNISRTYKSC